MQRRVLILAVIMAVAAACATAATAVTASGATEAYLPSLQGVGTYVFPGFTAPLPPQGPGFTVDSARYPVGAALDPGPSYVGGVSFTLATNAPAGSVLTVCIGISDGVAGPLVGSETCVTSLPVTGDAVYGFRAQLPDIDIPPVGILPGEHRYLLRTRAIAPAGTTVEALGSAWTRIRW